MFDCFSCCVWFSCACMHIGPSNFGSSHSRLLVLVAPPRQWPSPGSVGSWHWRECQCAAQWRNGRWAAHSKFAGNYQGHSSHSTGCPARGRTSHFTEFPAVVVGTGINVRSPVLLCFSLYECGSHHMLSMCTGWVCLSGVSSLPKCPELPSIRALFSSPIFTSLDVLLLTPGLLICLMSFLGSALSFFLSRFLILRRAFLPFVMKEWVTFRVFELWSSNFCLPLLLTLCKMQALNLSRIYM